MLFASSKDKKSSHDNNEGKSAFQIVIELCKQPNKITKKHLRLVIISIRVDVASSVLEQLTVVLLVSL